MLIEFRVQISGLRACLKLQWILGVWPYVPHSFGKKVVQ